MQPLGSLKARPQAQVLLGKSKGLIEAPRREIRNCDAAAEKCHLGIERAQPHRGLAMFDRLVRVTGERQAAAEM